MNESEHDKMGFYVQTTKNPKPDALEYSVKTMNDLYQLVTEENVEKLLSDLAHSLYLMVEQKKHLKSEFPDIEKPALLYEWVWIDD